MARKRIKEDRSREAEIVREKFKASVLEELEYHREMVKMLERLIQVDQARPPQLPSATIPIPPSPLTPMSYLSLKKAIMMVLESNPQGLTPSEIKEKLLAGGFQYKGDKFAERVRNQVSLMARKGQLDRTKEDDSGYYRYRLPGTKEDAIPWGFPEE